MYINLGTPINDLLLHYKVDRGVLTLKRNYLEIVFQGFANTEKWKSFADVLALMIFGLVLFPHMKNFIDSTDISVFWGVKNQGVNLVPALLADVYYTINT